MTVDLNVVLPVAVNIAVLIAAFAGLATWFRRWVRKLISEPLEAMQLELSPNHGNSMNDGLYRIEYKVDALGTRFDDHLLLAHQATSGRPE